MEPIQMGNEANVKMRVETASGIRGTLMIALAAVLWANSIISTHAETVPKTGDTAHAEAFVDPQAVELLKKVLRRLRSIRTLSGVCTHTTRRQHGGSPFHTDVLVSASRIRLMRPNFTWTTTALLSQKAGGKVLRASQFRTTASDGHREWTVYHSGHEFYTGKVAADGHGLSFKDLAPLDGFFDPEDFVMAHIHALRKEGLLRRLVLGATVRTNGAPHRLVWLVYQRAGSQVIETHKYSIGADLLIHRIQISLSTGEVENSIDLSHVRIDAPMAKSTFAYSPPTGTHLHGDTPEEGVTSVLAKGALAPDATVQDAEGNPVRLADFRGKWVILDFWATWCAPCVQSFPGLNAIARQYKDKNVVALAISAGDMPKVFQAWLLKHNHYDTIRFAIDAAGIDGKGVDKLYKVGALPTQFLIDPTGRVSASFEGYDSHSHDRLAEALKSADLAPGSVPQTPQSP